MSLSLSLRDDIYFAVFRRAFRVFIQMHRVGDLAGLMMGSAQ